MPDGKKKNRTVFSGIQNRKPKNHCHTLFTLIFNLDIPLPSDILSGSLTSVLCDRARRCPGRDVSSSILTFQTAFRLLVRCAFKTQPHKTITPPHTPLCCAPLGVASHVTEGLLTTATKAQCAAVNLSPPTRLISPPPDCSPEPHTFSLFFPSVLFFPGPE